MPVRAPSTTWREIVAADEETRFAGYGASFVALQRAKSAKLGQGRAVHRKQHLGLRARFEVSSNLPAHAAHGLFARAGVHEARVRLSNGAAEVSKDSAPDVRGFGIEVRGIHGAGALGVPTTTQDFALIDRVAFGFPNADAFVSLVLKAAESPFAAIAHLVKRHGVLGGLKEGARIQRGFAKTFTGFATEHFYSAAPIACGPYAARVRLRPHAAANSSKQPANLADELAARLRAGPVTYDVQLQFFVDDAVTPIEDSSKEWPEDETPFVTVGRLTLVPQDVQSDEGKALAVETEAARFDPWCALEEHRPLGDIMRARRVVYFESQKERGAS